MARPRSSRSLAVSPFHRLARVHAVSAATDATIAVALAGSIFFSISPDAARSKVALYLVLTMAPFAVVTPLIGPVLDGLASGRRVMIFVTMIGRCVIAALMVKHLETLWLFPEAFALLIMQKGYAVAKSAVVPHYVPTESDFVQANSKLALLSAVMSLVGAGIGAGLVWMGDSSWASAAAVVGYGVSTIITIKLPAVGHGDGTSKQQNETQQDSQHADNVQHAGNSQHPDSHYTDNSRHSDNDVRVSVKRTRSIFLAASSMAVLRSAVGLVTFVMAFELRGGAKGVDVSSEGASLGAASAMMNRVDVDSYVNALLGEPGAPVWHFALVVIVASLCAFIGVNGAPALRSRCGEEMILLGSLVAGCIAASAAAIVGSIAGLAALAGGIALASSAGKLAFDSLVQRDAPNGNHGRFFAKFEARFQIAWVLGAFVPVMVSVSAQIGGTVVAAGLFFASVFLVLGHRVHMKT